jgi:hypothetical protein
MNPRLQRRRPNAMIGIDQSRIRLLPTRSISSRATQVMTRFVMATERLVSVGLSNPRIVKMVAEKYINEFCHFEVRNEKRVVRKDLRSHKVVADLAVSRQ